MARLVSAFLTAFTLRSSATILYVDANSTNPVPPFTGWSTAATNIQAALNAASALTNDTVLVASGSYHESLNFNGKPAWLTARTARPKRC